MLDRGERLTRILLFLVILAGLLVILAAGVFVQFGSVGLTGLNVVVSAILTAALVSLYFHQTSILESQRKLLTQEINRDARQQHTETLRRRVELWHGNPELERPDESFDDSQLNLPQVRGASFESAPIDNWFAISEEDLFSVVPSQLDGDRYLQDLLEHHAPELRETKEDIEHNYEAFVELRQRFIEEFDDGLVGESADYLLEPTDAFSRWLFDSLVLLERGWRDDYEEMRERALAELEGGDNSLQNDEPRLWIRVRVGGRTSFAVYEATWTENIEREAIRSQQEVVEAEAAELIREVLDRIDQQRPYQQVVEAASTLDAAAETVDRLEKLLVEYHGRPMYPGDCQYLEETEIRTI